MPSRHLLISLAFLASTCLHAAVDPVPGIINHQGRIAVSSADFTGNGLFSFSLVSGAGVVLWHHDGTPTGSAQPASQLTIAVDAGLYSVVLGDTGIIGMTAIPATVFLNGDVRLRIWFDDQAPVAMQQLSPDIRIASAGYAQRAAMIEDGAVTGASVANGSLTGVDLSNAAALSNAQVNDDLTIAGGTVNSSVIGGTSPAAASFTTLGASGATTLAGASATTLNVSGATTLAGATATTLGVSGATTLAGTSATTLTVSGETALNGAATLSGATAVTGVMQLGSSADHVSILADGTMGFTGAARLRRSAILTAASAITAPTGATVNLGGVNFAHYTVDFADALDQAAAWQFIVPDSFDAGSVEVTLYWTSSVATTTVDWTIAVDGRPTDGSASYDVAPGNSSTTTAAAPGSAGALKQTVATLASGWADGEVAVVQVMRSGTTDANNGTNPALVVKVEWIANAESD